MSVMWGWKEEDEYLGKENARPHLISGAPRLPSAFATERLLTDNRGGFSLDGHRLSSLYRIVEADVNQLTNRYFSAFSLKKYSPGVRGWKTPVVQHHIRAHHA